MMSKDFNPYYVKPSVLPPTPSVESQYPLAGKPMPKYIVDAADGRLYHFVKPCQNSEGALYHELGNPLTHFPIIATGTGRYAHVTARL